MSFKDWLASSKVEALIKQLQKHPIEIQTPIEATWGEYTFQLYATKGKIKIGVKE